MSNKRVGGPIAWMVHNPVAANLAMMVIVGAGLLSALTVKQEVFPEFDLDVVRVTVPYPGASPSEVEQGILLALEEAVRGLDDVKRVNSSASEGIATANIELLRGANAEEVSANVKSAVDRIQTFPDNAEEPTVTVVSQRSQVISLVIAGDHPLATLHDIAEQARTELLQGGEITQAELQGVRPLEISIEVPMENLEAHGLTLEDVARQVGAASLELPAGAIESAGGEILVRVSDRKLDRRQFENIIVRSSGAGELRLKDIATVVDGYADTDQASYFNGKRAVRVTAYRVGDESPIDVANTVKAYLLELRKQVPESIELAVWNDRSKLLRERIDLLVRNARAGLILVLVVLALFLKPRLAGWVGLGIPISFLGTFVLFEPADLSINMITLFGLIITLGIVVDDAIIVGENIYSHSQSGVEYRAAAITGAREMAVPVTFSILTTIAAFGPLLFIPGALGQIFRLIPMVVISVLTLSLFESFFILPAHLAHPGSNRLKNLLAPLERIQVPVANWLERFTQGRYALAVRWFAENRYVALSSGIAVLTVTFGLLFTGIVPFSFLPKLEGDIVVATARLQFGSPIEQNLRVKALIENAVEKTIEDVGGRAFVRGVFSNVGSGFTGGGPRSGDAAMGSHILSVEVNLVGSDERTFSTQNFGDAWLSHLPPVPGVEALTIKTNIGGPSSEAVAIQVSHPDTQVLAEVSEYLARTLRDYPGLINVENGYAAGKPQLNYKLLPEARTFNVTGLEVARQLRHAFYGGEALREQRGRNELRVFVRLPENERQNEPDLKRMLIRTPGGHFVPLGVVASFTRGRAPATIDREDGQRIVTVKADLSPEIPSPRGILSSLQSEIFPGLKQRYGNLAIDLVGEQRDQGETFDSMGRNFLLAILVIYALLAIPFRSYVQPLIVMSAIPFGMVGAVAGHVLFGYSISVISLMGMIALSGVVVNDSLILVSAINRFCEEGQSPVDAVVAGGQRRLRPIFLTSLTTFFGLAPMIAETSIQARFLIPMALSLGFGVLFATVIVLLLVPALYLVVEDIRRITN